MKKTIQHMDRTRARLSQLAALCLAAALCLTGCGGNGGPGTAETNAGGAAQTAEAVPSAEEVTLPYLTAGQPEAETVYRIALCADRDQMEAETAIQAFQTRLDKIGQERNCAFALSVEYAMGKKDAADAVSLAVSQLPDSTADLFAGLGDIASAAARDAAADALKKAAKESSREPAPDAGETAPDTAEEGETAPDAAVFPAVYAFLPEAADDALTGGSAVYAAPTDGVSLVNLLMRAESNARKVGILYNGEDKDSVAAVRAAVERFQDHGVELVERTGSTADELQIAAQSLAADGVDAVYSPADALVLEAEGTVGGILTEAGIPHYAASPAFASAGAYLGYGVWGKSVGEEAAVMAAALLLDGVQSEGRTSSPVAILSDRVCGALGRRSIDVRAVVESAVPLREIPGN